MKILIAVVVSACSIMLAGVAFSESATAPQTTATAPPTSVISTNSAAPVPVATSKRMACSGAAQSLTGQDRNDQMQLCMAQARLDCLKQAIDQKVVGPERRDFVKSCVGE